MKEINQYIDHVQSELDSLGMQGPLWTRADPHSTGREIKHFCQLSPSSLCLRQGSW